jgi:hypothetical protein
LSFSEQRIAVAERRSAGRCGVASSGSATGGESIPMVLPVVVLLGLRTSQPIAAQAFDTPTSQLVLAGAVVALGVGYALMLYLACMPADERERVAAIRSSPTAWRGGCGG